MTGRLLVLVPIALVLTSVWMPSVRAGELEPPGSPAPTMKSLDSIPPSWDQTLPSQGAADPCNSPRFKCVMNPVEAVLDRETGLVWEQTPSAAPTDWYGAERYCTTRFVGGRMGWRLPTVEDLLTLGDPTATDGLARNHPFANIGNSYWTSTSAVVDDTRAVVVAQGTTLFDTPKTQAGLAWCVRGGSGHLR